MALRGGKAATAPLLTAPGKERHRSGSPAAAGTANAARHRGTEGLPESLHPTCEMFSGASESGDGCGEGQLAPR